MATYSAPQLQRCRQWLAGESVTVNYTKATANTAIQAIEDWFAAGLTTAPATSLNGAINAATSPLTLSAAVKKKFVACWAREKFDIERA